MDEINVDDQVVGFEKGILLEMEGGNVHCKIRRRRWE